MYKPVDPKVSFPTMEESILKFWKDQQIFEKSLEKSEGHEDFVFYDGPPFATGLPHYGHILAGTIKDVIPRYQTMKGKRVSRRFGWDCHGLPVEYEMEKQLKISGKTEIEKYGVANFNEACRSIVLRYTNEWRQVITRSGRWVDFDNDYKTMDPDYMESIWWVVKQLWEKELVYEGHYILPYCPRCSTPLSNHELNLGGHKDVHDPAITVRFRSLEEENTYFLAWTTTPWTLPSNLALTAGPDIDYVKVKDGEDHFILAEALLPSYYKNEEDYQIIWKKKGSEIKGMTYEPLFPYFADRKEQGAFQIYNADFVSTEDGTGLVHTASGFGEDDYEVLRPTDVEPACPVDEECQFTSEVSDYQGRFVKDCDKDIINRLKEEGKLIKRDQILHAYPHCWRCESPLIYRAISSWFVKIDPIKQKMLDANDTIHWVPSHLQQGRFGKWLQGARDWSISRNRYWGNPIPIWDCPDCGERLCVGSREELKELSGKEVDDLHKHFVDEITIPCKCGGTMKRIPEVLDCWFESGSMPYAQVHYPFENKEWFEKNFPANFIAEGLDQTRGWFYTLTVLAAALFDGPAFQNVVVNGLILAADGKKMSKSLRNFTDPMEILNQFGADSMRLYLMNSAAVRGESLRFTDDGVRDVLKSIILPLWNSYSFLVTYANIDKAQPSSAPDNPSNPLDQWIISETERLIAGSTECMDDYELHRAVEPMLDFIDSLNNWYIRRSRRRFWKSENDDDKFQAYETLWYALINLVKVAAPFIPFVTEEIYQNLRTDDMPESVHLSSYPEADENRRDTLLERKMELTRQTVSMGRALRTSHKLKTRQPLKALHLVTRNKEEKTILLEMVDIISEELNVKEVLFRDNEEELVEYSAKANFKVLGRKLGKDMKAAASKIAELSADAIQSLMDGAVLSLDIDGVEHKNLELTQEAVVIQRSEKAGLKVLNEGSLTVALDPEITEELLQEGIVRDLIRGIQNLRKESDLDVTDRIVLSFNGSELVQQSLQNYEEYFKQETLTDSWNWTDQSQSNEITCGEDQQVSVSIEKQK